MNLFLLVQVLFVLELLFEQIVFLVQLLLGLQKFITFLLHSLYALRQSLILLF